MTPETKARMIDQLRDILKPGDTVNCVGRHTSRSGASRSVSLFAQIGPDLIELDEWAAPALGLSADRKHGGIRVYSTQDGVSVDAALAIVSSLGAALGYPLRHRWM